MSVLSKQVQGELLFHLILRRERDEIEEEDFHHIAKAILKCIPHHPEPHDNVSIVTHMMLKDRIPAEDRPPGAPGSRPKGRN